REQVQRDTGHARRHQAGGAERIPCGARPVTPDALDDETDRRYRRRDEHPAHSPRPGAGEQGGQHQPEPQRGRGEEHRLEHRGTGLPPPDGVEKAVDGRSRRCLRQRGGNGLGLRGGVQQVHGRIGGPASEGPGDNPGPGSVLPGWMSESMARGGVSWEVVQPSGLPAAERGQKKGGSVAKPARFSRLLAGAHSPPARAAQGCEAAGWRGRAPGPPGRPRPLAGTKLLGPVTERWGRRRSKRFLLIPWTRITSSGRPNGRAVRSVTSAAASLGLTPGSASIWSSVAVFTFTTPVPVVRFALPVVAEPGGSGAAWAQAAESRAATSNPRGLTARLP